MTRKISIFFLSLMGIGLIYGIFRGYLVNSDLDNYGKESIGRFVSYRKHAKSADYNFTFYIDGKKYKENAGRMPKGFRANRGKFYKIIYSEKYKGSFRVFIDQEVTDTLKILEAGFSNEEIRKSRLIQLKLNPTTP